MSKKIWIIIASIIGIAAVAAIVLIVVLSTKGTPNDKPIEDEHFRSILVEKLSGNVLVNRKDKDLEAYQNMNLRSGDTITTNDTSSTILKLDGDKFVYIGENSNVNLISSEYDSSKTIIRVNEGSIVTEVKNKLSDLEEFGVETPNSSMAIRGTIFSVTVRKQANNVKIDYKLLEGNIELSVIEKTTNGLKVGKFNMKPMEEVNIVSKDDQVVEKEELTNALGLINSQDATVTVNNYDTASDYVASSENIEVSNNDLEVNDVDDILRNLPSNATSEQIRLVTVDATFRIVTDGITGNDSFMKYDSDKAFTVSIYCDSKKLPVIGWIINGMETDGDNPFTYEVTKTTLIEPIYGEPYSASGITVKPTTYTTINVVSYGETETSDTITTDSGEKNYADASSVELSYVSFSDPNKNIAFLGWYEETDSGYVFISKETEYTLAANRAMVVTPLFVTLEEMPLIYLYGNDNPLNEDYLFELNINERQLFRFDFGDFMVPLEAANISLSYQNKTEADYYSYLQFEDGYAKFLSSGQYGITWSFNSVEDDSLIDSGSFNFAGNDVFFSLDFGDTLAEYEISKVEGYVCGDYTYCSSRDSENRVLDINSFATDMISYESYDEYSMQEKTGDLSSITFTLSYDSDRFKVYTIDSDGTVLALANTNIFTLYASMSDIQGDYKSIILVDRSYVDEDLTGHDYTQIIWDYVQTNPDSSAVKVITYDSIPS